MNEATDLLLLSVAAAAKEGKYFDIYQAIGRMTLQVVGTTAFGYDPNCSLFSSGLAAHEHAAALRILVRPLTCGYIQCRLTG